MKFKKALLTLFCSLIILLPTITVFAYSYAFTYDFKYKLTSSLYYLYPDDGYVYMTTTSTGGGAQYFYVDIFYEGTYRTTKAMTNRGTDSQYFIVPKYAGNYRFVMRKADDGYYVTGYGRINDWRNQ